MQTSLRDVLFILFKRKWSILVILLATVATAVVWLWGVREELYTASSKVLVKLGQEQAAPPTMIGGLPQVTGYRYQEVNSEVEILQNVELISQVVDEFGLDKPGPEPPRPTQRFAQIRYDVKKQIRTWKAALDDLMVQYGLREKMTPRQAMIYTLTQALSVHGQKDSNLFVAELTMPYRESVAVILNRLIEDYLVFRSKAYRNSGMGYFKDRADQLAAEMQKTDAALQEYEKAGNISVLAKQQEQLVEQIAAAEAAVNNSRIAMDEAVSKVERVNAELRKSDPNFGSIGESEKDSFPQNVLRQLAELQRERERLRMTELDGSDRVQNNRQQFRVLVDMLAANLASSQAEKRADFETRNRALNRMRTELAALHDRQMNWEALRRKSKGDTEIYDFYRRKVEETSTASAMERQRIGNVVVVERATEPVVPAGVRKIKMLALCLVMGVFAALAWISVAEFFDHRIFTREALERRLEAPVIAVIPRSWRVLPALARSSEKQLPRGINGS